MKIWKEEFDLNSLNHRGENTLVSTIGIKITNFGEDFLEGTMPVDQRTKQPYGILHGGASCVLAETLGSIAANLCLDGGLVAVGQHIEATHLRIAEKGIVTGITKAVYLGKTTQTWRIEIFNEENKLVCDSKLIMAVIKRE